METRQMTPFFSSTYLKIVKTNFDVIPLLVRSGL